MAFSCEEENEDAFKNGEGYIVGSVRCGETDGENGQSTGELIPRGFLIILENESDSMYTFSLSEDSFGFPVEILTPDYNNQNCGPTYFPDKKEYKIKFKYRNSKESEKIYFVCGCYDYLIPYDWSSSEQVILEEVIQINN